MMVWSGSAGKEWKAVVIVGSNNKPGWFISLEEGCCTWTRLSVSQAGWLLPLVSSLWSHGSGGEAEEEERQRRRRRRRETRLRRVRLVGERVDVNEGQEVKWTSKGSRPKRNKNRQLNE
jgi:hypothetical protein